LSVTSITPQTSAPWITLSPLPPYVIPYGSSQAVVVTVNFTNAPTGQSTTRLLVGSNDPDENPYPNAVDITVNKPAPVMAVIGNGNIITNNDLAPSAADFTDFGLLNVSGGVLTRTFTITNSSAVDLNLTAATRVGVLGSADFTIFSQPGTPVSGGGSTTFQVRFDPGGSGPRSATLVITNDSLTTPYTFGVRGSGIAPAQITSVFITNGQLNLVITGGIGQIFDIEYSSNLLAWTPLLSLTNSGGSVQYSEPPVTNIPSRFFRTGLR
jgi:hypothetical protein